MYVYREKKFYNKTLGKPSRYLDVFLSLPCRHKRVSEDLITHLYVIVSRKGRLKTCHRPTSKEKD